MTKRRASINIHRKQLSDYQQEKEREMGLLTLFIMISFTVPVALSDSKPSAYEVLEDYNLPVGILPKGVTRYELNRETGEFSAHINKTCSFSVDSYDHRRHIQK